MSVSWLLLLALAQSPSEGGDARELDALRKRVVRDRVRVKYLKREEFSILAGLRRLDREIAAKERRVRRIQTRFLGIEGDVQKLGDRRSALRRQKEVLATRAGRRAAAMVRLARTRLSRLVSRERRPSEARRLRDRLRRVLAHDVRLFERAAAARKELGSLEAKLEEERMSLVSERTRLDQEADGLAALREERSALLAAIREERRASVRLARELARSAEELESELGVLRGREPAPDRVPGGFLAQKGRLPWPAPGYVEVTFGKKVDPGSGMVVRQSGIDLRAAPGTPVRAVYDGRVAFVGRLRGYGRTVVLSHDGGAYHSVYAHLERLAVRNGQTLLQYGVLGEVGDSGSSKGPHLYFEVRTGRDARDPLGWLAP